MEDNYRDIHEYHDKCFYCVCKTCKAENCKGAECDLCEGGENDSRAKCRKKICTIPKELQDRYKYKICLWEN